jgi:hypothetical protein
MLPRATFRVEGTGSLQAEHIAEAAFPWGVPAVLRRPLVSWQKEELRATS